MKIVINTCFGGFGISDEAFEKLLERKGIVFHRLDGDGTLLGGNNYYHEGHAGEDEFYISHYDYYDDRSDPDLIAVIEEMGKESWGWASELAILEIPDDVKWHIHEYDGMEHVAENHRTWYA